MRLFVLALALCLVGCATQGRPVISERAQPRPDPPPNTSLRPDDHIVKRGDTLYSIAWRYRLDVKYIAARNGLSSPYTIFPGQRLALRGAPPRQTRPAAPKPSVKKTPPKAKPARFAWPVSAKPSREYGRGNKGLDFALPRRTAVKAAAAGDVVYAGTGLGGYATLVIIRHGGGYLSAYSFFREALVDQGESIKAGGKIADIGGTGRAANLHFEIRKDGEPISPRSVLR